MISCLDMLHETFGKIKTAVHRNYRHTVCAYKLNWTILLLITAYGCMRRSQHASGCY